ncbi:MAG: PAS domain S-box protein [Halobacteriales archaeon]|nr:PAS domain S-box protein [Halobacteriales archaeon]
MGDRYLKQNGGGVRRSDAMDASADGMAILDDDEFVYVNEAYVGLHGYDGPEEILGRTWHEMYGEDEVERIGDVFSDVHKTGVWRGESTGVRADGTEFPQEVSVSHVEDGNVVCVVRDVTERKEREKELERYEAFIEKSTDVITHLGEDGTVMYQSPSLEDVLGYEYGETVGDYAFEYVHPDDRERVIDRFMSTLENPDTRTDVTEFRVRHADGSYVWLEDAGGTPVDAKVDGLVLNLREITERKERERELERYEAFIENSSDSITHMDEDGTILYRSPSEERRQDEPDDMSGTYAFDHVHPEDRERALEKFQELLSDPDKTSDSVEYRSERADGTYDWVEAVATDQRDTEVGGVVVNTRDINGRKEREKELERYETFVENSSDILVHVADDGTIVYHSPSVERILGHEQGERLGEDAFDYLHPEDTERVYELFDSVTGEDGDDKGVVEFRAEHTDGGYVWLEARARNRNDTEIDGLVVNARDISERKEREKELERYEAFVESSSDVIIHIDEDGTIIYNSPSIEDVFGYGQEENVGDNAFEYVHPDDRERMVELFAASLKGTNDRDENAEFRVKNAEGDYIWVEDAAGNQTHPKIDGDVLNLRDITERKDRERELREEKSRHRALVDSFPNGAVFLFDEDLRFSIAGGTELDNVNLSPEDIEGRTLEEVFSDEVVEKHEKYYRKALEGKGACFENEYEGNVYRVWTVPVRDDEGEIFSGIAFSQNVTERKKRERELEMYEAIVENTSDVVTVIDEDGTMLYQSPSVKRVMGYGQHERVGENGFDYMHPEDRERALETFQKVVNDPETDTVEEELRFQRADGSYIWLDVRGTDQRDTDVGGFVINARDISERKERDEELRRNREILGHTERIADTGGWEYEVEDDVLRWTEGTYEVHGLPTDDEVTVDEVAELYHPEDRRLVGDAIEDCIKHGEPYETEVRLVNGDDGVRWVRTGGEPVREDGQTVKIRGAVQDVTDRKEREKELERYEALIKNSLDIFSVLDEDGVYTYSSPSVERILGYSPDEHTGEYSLDYVHPDDRTDAVKWFYSIVEGDAVISETELRYRNAEGDYVWFEIIGTDQRDTEVGGIVFNARDISERKEMEGEIRESRRRLSTLMGNLPGMAYRAKNEPNWPFEFVSEGCGDLTGYTAEELEENEGLWGEEIIDPEHTDRLWDEVQEALENEESFRVTYPIHTKDGEERWMWEQGCGVYDDEGNVEAIEGFITDITERKERERELEMYEAYIQNSSDIITHLDEEGNVVYQSPATERIMGRDPSERVGESALEYVHPDDKDHLVEKLDVLMSDDIDKIEVEFRSRREDGEYIWLDTIGTDQRDTEYGGIIVNSRDITERKKNKQELERNRELLGHAERISDTGGWEVDVETDELRWTDGTREIHEVSEGYKPTVEDAVEFYHTDDRDEIRRAVEMCTEEGKPFDKELRLVTSEDRLRWCRSRGEPVRKDGEIVKLRGAIQDITDRKERERELRERKDQIDFFNSLLRHDMLNSMTVINGSVDILLDELPEGDEKHELAERIDKHSTGIVDLTERVRSVLRRLTENGSTEMSPVDVTEVVEERVEELEESYDVTCSLKASDDVRVEADLFLDHVVDNLLVNAVEHNDKDEPRVEVTVEGDDEKATVRVADNGPGVPDEKKDTVFEQGTTGRTSGGVGFGLYYVDAMVSEYGGEVSVEDGENGGAVFVVELPKAAEHGEGTDEKRDGDGNGDVKSGEVEMNLEAEGSEDRTDVETDHRNDGKRDSTETDKWRGTDTGIGGG